MITHDTGFAHFKASDGPLPETIALTPWARAEGVFRVGAKPAANIELELYGVGIQSYERDQPRIFTQHRVTTGPGGYYEFERVFPGKGRIGRRILLMVDEGATEVTSSSRVPATFSAGETTTLELGNAGRAVVGKLLPPENHVGEVHWNFALVNLSREVPQPEPPPIPQEVAADANVRAIWLEEWSRTPKGRAWAEWQSAREAAPLSRRKRRPRRHLSL